MVKSDRHREARDELQPFDESSLPQRSKTAEVSSCVVESMIESKNLDQELEQQKKKEMIREMSQRSFNDWCRKKLRNLRLRKVVEDEESEKDSWNKVSNQVD